ncbi:MFS 1 domain containing protein [Trichuris trichiura]|uniref:MFS 1 domain containing protein n=1 Tax=Trichuris trichiura TaxID=36087 RepID=A0A077Z1E2_TRITR|nr:MFS 1 domain containing protein [Trichuris trichiura]
MPSDLPTRIRSISQSIDMQEASNGGSKKSTPERPDANMPPVTKGEQLIADALIARADGGWGWVVVMAVFVSSVIFDGILLSAGQAFIPIWTKYFMSTPSSVSLVFSLQNMFYSLTGPISGAFVNAFGCRIVGLAGSALAGLGFILSVFATSVEFLCFTYGVMAGVGFGAMYLCGIIIISEYFETKRSLATGIAVCGSGVGSFVFPPIFTLLVENYSWQQVMLIIAGVELHCLVCAALFRAVTPEKKQVEKVEETLVSMLQSEFPGNSTDGKESLSFVKRGASEVIPPSHKLSQTLSIDGRSDSVISDTASNVVPQEDHARRRFVRALSQTASVRSSFARRFPVRQLSMVVVSRFSVICVSIPSVYDLRNVEMNKRQELRKISYASIQSFNRPLQRLDALYQGSVKNINAKTGITEGTISTAAPVTVDREDVKSIVCMEKTHTWRQSIKQAVEQLIDFKLLRSPSFLLFVSACFLASVGFNVPYLYLPRQAEMLGNSVELSSLLLSIIGIVNTIARVVCGWMADRPEVDCIVIFNCANFVTGISTMLLPHFITYPLLSVYCCLFGAGIGALMSMRSLVTLKLVGIGRLTSAFGLLLLFNGIAVFLGPPMAAALFESTGTYQLSFYISGGLMTVAGAAGLGLNKLLLWEQSRQGKKCEELVGVHGTMEKNKTFSSPAEQLKI